MRYAALSDLHLGFRGMGRTVNGRNQREVDVETAWAAAVQKIVELRPDLVTIAGDVFHSVRPSFHAVRAFQSGVRVLTEEGIHVVIITGNHEGPRTAETLTPNVVVESLAHVVTRPEHRVLCLDSGEEVAVACLPFVALGEERRYSVEPLAAADVNLLLIHAAVRSSARPGALPPMYGGAAAYDVARAEGFDVVACGDYHEFTVLNGYPLMADEVNWSAPEEGGPLAFYSGSIERTSSNIWQEEHPKGFVLGDTDARTMEFVEIPTREMVNITANHGSTDALNDFLAELLEYGSRDALVRLRVDGFPRGEREAIDWSLVAALKEAHVLFHLDLRMEERGERDLGDRRERQGRTLADEAGDFFEEDDEAVREAAFGYLGVEQREVVHA